MNQKILLSKSKIKELMYCELNFYNTVNNLFRKEWSKNDLFVFEQGRIVEQIARDKFPKAILQDKQKNYEKVLLTKELMQNKSTIFEAAFVKKNTIVQFDILFPHDDFSWNAIEIKSASSFKDDYKTDVLIQYWIATLAGLEINKFELWYVNNKSKSSLDEDYFVKEDITNFCKENEKTFWKYLNRALDIVMMKNPPMETENHICSCSDCPYTKMTLDKYDSASSVFNLPNFRSQKTAISKGIFSLEDPNFEKEFKYSENYPNVVKSIKENKLVIDQENLLKEFNSWKFPLNFFDFETLTSAIPILEGQTPYSQVVVQFSNHTWDGKSLKLDHSEYLHMNKTNPEIPAIESMLSVLEKNEGSIPAWFMTFEKTRIKDLAKKHPQYKDRLLKLVERFVDVMDLVKSHVYHPKFKSSFSLKVVSPVLLEDFGSYSNSLIKSGSEISYYYEKMLNTDNVEEKNMIASALKKYCCYDTINLFLIIDFLFNQDLSRIEHIIEVNGLLCNESEKALSESESEG